MVARSGADAVRREVLGDAHVDRSTAAGNDFTRPFLDLAVEYAWGRVWTRTELDRRTRSLVTLALLTALGREDEVKLHTRGALRNGCTLAEIREVFVQASVYCGVPIAQGALRAAADALAQDGKI